MGGTHIDIQADRRTNKLINQKFREMNCEVLFYLFYQVVSSVPMGYAVQVSQDSIRESYFLEECKVNENKVLLGRAIT